MRDQKKLKFFAYSAVAIYLVIFILYGFVKYDFTLNRPINPDPLHARTKQIEGFYERHIYVTNTEQIVFYLLEIGMQVGFVIVFAVGALYWRRKR